MFPFKTSTWNLNEFAPGFKDQDNRDRRVIRQRQERSVKKNWQDFCIPSLTIVPETSTNRETLYTMAHYPPHTPMARYLESAASAEWLAGLDYSMRETQELGIQLKIAKEQNQMDEFRRLLQLPAVVDQHEDPAEGNEAEEIERDPRKFFPLPSRPLFSLDRAETEQYFGKFIDACYKWENVEKYQKWPVKEKGEKPFNPATALELYDQKANDLLDR